jgi:hypothetical protein
MAATRSGIERTFATVVGAACRGMVKARNLHAGAFVSVKFFWNPASAAPLSRSQLRESAGRVCLQSARLGLRQFYGGVRDDRSDLASNSRKGRRRRHRRRGRPVDEHGGFVVRFAEDDDSPGVFTPGLWSQ